jgi:hypothetical protein
MPNAVSACGRNFSCVHHRSVITITSQTGLLIFVWFICRIILYNGAIMPFLADKMKKIAVLITILTQVPVILGQLKIPKHRKKQ